MTNSSCLISGMTAFVSESLKLDSLELLLEIKSLNSRFLDLQIKLPSELNQLEPEIRKIIKNSIARGRIEVNLKHSNQTLNKPQLNLDFFKSYWELLAQAAKAVSVDPKNLDFSTLSTVIFKQDQVFSGSSSLTLSTEQSDLLLTKIKDCLQQLITLKSNEGQEILYCLLVASKNLEDIFSQIKNLQGSVISNLAQDLIQKMKSLFQQLDFTSERIEQEVAWKIERSDITEELNRIEMHLHNLATDLKIQVSGKKLEFLCQELIREFNTISAKVNSGEISSLVIKAKLEIEKIKEQSFNLE